MNTANKLTLLRVVMIPAFLLVLYLHVPGASRSITYSRR